MSENKLSENKLNKAVLRYKHSRHSIKGIVEQLDNVDLFKSINSNLFPAPIKEYDKLIRWGCIGSLPLPSDAIQYNKPKAISAASNKLKARRTMAENSVPIPKTWGYDELPKFPCVGRPLRHFGGRKFFYCENEYDLKHAKRNGAEYFSEYYPKTKEYRVHVASGKVLIMAEKITPEKVNNKPWNLNSRGVCEEFSTLRWGNYPKEICGIATEATKALGLDFGAVDIMADPLEEDLPPAVVLEVNTAPKLGEYGQERYAEYFKWLFAHDEKVEPFEANTQRDYWFTHRELEV